LTITALENNNMVVFPKPAFMFRDAAPDTDQQLLAGEDPWIFTIGGEKYYLHKSKRHFPSDSSDP